MPESHALPQSSDENSLNLLRGCYQCGDQFDWSGRDNFFFCREAKKPWKLHIICVHCQENLLDEESKELVQ